MLRRLLVAALAFLLVVSSVVFFPERVEAKPAVVEVDWQCNTILITSNKDLSNLVWLIDGVDTELFLEDVKTFLLDDSVADVSEISDLWVKSGSNRKRGEEKGRGEHFTRPNPDPCNDPPTAFDDAATVDEGAVVNVDVAGNDTDADDGLDLTSVSIVSGPANGGLLVNPDGTVDYTHDGSETVSDSFTYTIDDASAATSNTATVLITVTPLIDMSISLADELVGVGRTNDGTITLDSPAGVGGLTVTLSLNTAIATVSPVMVLIPEGMTEGFFQVTGVSVGITTLTGTGVGVTPAAAQVEVTDQLISIDNVPVIAPGETADLPVSITAPAPPGGVTINLESLDPSIAITDATTFIAEGLQIPATNPQVTGVALGITTIRATAVNFAPATRGVTVALDVTLTPQTLNIPQTQTRQVSAQLSAPAPAGGITVELSLDNPTLATLPASVFISAGQTLSGPIDLTAGSTLGTTTLHAGGPGLVEDTATINVVEAPEVFMASSGSYRQHFFVGVDLQSTARVRLEVAPPGPVDVVVSVPAGSGVLLSASATAVGVESLTVAIGMTSTSTPLFYIQGIVEGDDVDDDVPFTIEVFNAGTTVPAGYVPRPSDVDVGPTGFDFNTSGDLVTTTFSSNTNVQVRTALLYDSEGGGTLHNRRNQQNVRGGHPGISVDLTNTVPGVGTLTTPVVISANTSSVNAVFDPLTAGTTVLGVTQPSGYITPANGNATRNAIVDAPDLWLSFLSGSRRSSEDIGHDLQISRSIRLEVAAPAPGVDVTVEIIDPTVALISTDPTVAGSATLTFPLVTGTTAISNLYIQGLVVNQGTELRITAPGYDQWIATIQIIDSGFYISSPTSISTTSGASNTTIQIRSASLNPNQTVKSNQAVRGGASLDVAVISSDPSVGTIVTSPVTFTGGDLTLPTEFDPVAAGTTTISITQPPGFTPVAAKTSIIATVS